MITMQTSGSPKKQFSSNNHQQPSTNCRCLPLFATSKRSALSALFDVDRGFHRSSFSVLALSSSWRSDPLRGNQGDTTKVFQRQISIPNPYQISSKFKSISKYVSRFWTLKKFDGTCRLSAHEEKWCKNQLNRSMTQ